MASIQHFPIGELAKDGLLLQAAFPIGDLGPEISAPLAQSLAETRFDLDSFSSLVLMGQAGTTLYDRTVSDKLGGPDPFDAASLSLVDNWFHYNAPESTWTVVYPGTAALPLGQLATQAGWGKPSPMGLTIHPHYGLWIAHRIAFLTDIAWDYTEGQQPHPCESCADRPCESACPVGAVSLANGFALSDCVNHRAPVGSDCEYQCFARNACPVGASYRYGPKQMRHHYAAGLKSIREWLA